MVFGYCLFCVGRRAQCSPWPSVYGETSKGANPTSRTQRPHILEFSKKEKCILHYFYKYDTITITVKEKVYYCGGIQ